MSFLIVPLLLIVGGVLFYAASSRDVPGKHKVPPMTEEQLFQQQLLQVQRDYLQAMQRLEQEARMTQGERTEVLHRMRDYHNHH